jgi:hypothetical protein
LTAISYVSVDIRVFEKVMLLQGFPYARSCLVFFATKEVDLLAW